MGWQKIERLIEEQDHPPCTGPYDHIWSGKRGGGYCVMCGLIIGPTRLSPGSKVQAQPIAQPNAPVVTRVKRPTWSNRANTVERLIERDGNECYYCGIPLVHEITTIDHLVPLCKGRKYHVFSNWRLACKQCNLWKGSDSAAELRERECFKQRRRDVRKLKRLQAE